MTRIASLNTVDTTVSRLFFSTLIVRDCWNEMGPVIGANLSATIEQCAKPGTREHQKALYRHDNPAGNLFSLCFGLCESERFAFIVRLIEFLCIIDDVLKDLPHGEALVEREILCDALRGPQNVPMTLFTPNTRPEWIEFLQDIKAEMLMVDPIRTPALILMLEESLRARDSSNVEFDTIERFVSQLILWAMDVNLKEEEADSDLLHDFKYSVGVIAGLVNDYFSWEREKRQQQESDRIRNGVAVLMKHRNLSDQEAKAAVKEMIVEEELKIRMMTEECQLEMSDAMRRYLKGLEMFAGGYSFWCATCPRYNEPEGDE
ncbi:terpenoid synthase [Marasmius fiardii PR-910]|nr:terpenoid synthase [Marasmius fiardii PR-910]